jgi:hypothetical protein
MDENVCYTLCFSSCSIESSHFASKREHTFVAQYHKYYRTERYEKIWDIWSFGSGASFVLLSSSCHMEILSISTTDRARRTMVDASTNFEMNRRYRPQTERSTIVPKVTPVLSENGCACSTGFTQFCCPRGTNDF